MQARFVDGAGVVHRVIRRLALLCIRTLKTLPSLEFPFLPTALGDSTHPGGVFGVDVQDRIALLSQGRIEQEGNIQDQQPFSRGTFARRLESENLGLDGRPNAGVDEGFETTKSLGRAEDPSGYRLAVHGAVSTEDLGSEPTLELASDFRFFQCFVRLSVCIDNLCATFS